MQRDFFPQRPQTYPKIYAYRDTNPQFDGMIKVGFTSGEVKERVAQQYPTLTPGPPPYHIVLEEPAIRNDGSSFTDHEVHRYLRNHGIINEAGEWFRCSADDVKAVIIEINSGQINEENRTLVFNMRPEQKQVVEKTYNYFSKYSFENTGHVPRFLWNAKMRFGKTFAAYHLAKKMNWSKVLVLTFKPAVQNAWESDLLCHIDFRGWQFIKPGGLSYEEADKSKQFVCFGSFQDYLGRNPSTGGIKTKNEWVHAIHWDCIIFDEYHYGAWRDKAQDLFMAEDKEEIAFAQGEGIEYYDEEIMPITTNAYLYLSGTPFRAIASGEFIEDQIFNWTYSDEQKAKGEYQGDDNPYLDLPRMVLMTYQLPDSIIDIAKLGEFNEFDLSAFFLADGEYEQAKFIYESDVQKWLDLIRGSYLGTSIDNLKLRAKKPPYPYSDIRLLNVLSHTLWFLPSVASCYAMRNLINQKQNSYFHDYEIVVAAGPRAGIGVDALPPVYEAMGNPLETKTITLTCGKLTTGVTVKPWTGIFMLRNSSSPETYFQASFRVQNPWTIKNPDKLSPNREEIMKHECYVFDFAPDRALRQIADYSCRLDIDETNPEAKVNEFIKFLPVLAYDGSSMSEIDAAGILDIALSGTTATLLARRWESALLVNVDNDTLRRILNSQKALNALMNIEGFRNLNQDIETIINKSAKINKTKREKNDEKLSSEEKRELTKEEKEIKNKRKIIKEKLIKFATRIPIFMYLTDFREHTLKDVITKLEPELFNKVTGLTVDDFELLVSIGVFNNSLMNDAVYKFKRYEDSSLEYTGINKHEGERIGLYDTVINSKDYKRKIFENITDYN